MTHVVVLPHARHCPDGAQLEAPPGLSLCDALLEAGILIPHECQKSCACATCRVSVTEGLDSLTPVAPLEHRLIGKVRRLQPQLRLACQAKLGTRTVVLAL